MGVFVADYNFRGLHAFSVDLLTNNFSGTTPVQVHQFAGLGRGIGKSAIDLVGHVALVSIE